MIKLDEYDGFAYYFYSYENDIEFGYFYIKPYEKSVNIFNCRTIYFVGNNTNTINTERFIGSNQLHGQNVQNGKKYWHKYQNWYKSVLEIQEKHVLVQGIFTAREFI